MPTSGVTGPSSILPLTSGAHVSLGSSRSTGVPTSGVKDCSQLIPPCEGEVLQWSTQLEVLGVRGSMTVISCLSGRPRLFSWTPLAVLYLAPQSIFTAINPSLPLGSSLQSLSFSTQTSVAGQVCKLLLRWEVLVGNDLCGGVSVLPSEHLSLHSL